MSRTTAELAQIVAGREPVAIVLHRDLTERQELADLLQTLVPFGAESERADTIDRVFDETSFNHVLLVMLPDASQEALAIDRLERHRDALMSREATAVVFLPSHSEAAKLLRQKPSLSSWLRGQIYNPGFDEFDPERDTFEDVEVARQQFENATQATPEVWWKRWVGGDIPRDDLTNQLLALEAERLRWDEDAS